MASLMKAWSSAWSGKAEERKQEEEREGRSKPSRAEEKEGISDGVSRLQQVVEKTEAVCDVPEKPVAALKALAHLEDRIEKDSAEIQRWQSAVCQAREKALRIRRDISDAAVRQIQGTARSFLARTQVLAARLSHAEQIDQEEDSVVKTKTTRRGKKNKSGSAAKEVCATSHEAAAQHDATERCRSADTDVTYVPGDVINNIHFPKKGPPKVLPSSFGVVVTEELVLDRCAGKVADLGGYNSYGVIDLRTGEVKSIGGGCMRRARRSLLDSTVNDAPGHAERGRVCQSTLDLLELRLAKVQELVWNIYLQGEKPDRGAELRPMIEAGYLDGLVQDPQDVGRMIARLFSMENNLQVTTWANVTALGKLFLELTEPASAPAEATPCVGSRSRDRDAGETAKANGKLPKSQKRKERSQKASQKPDELCKKMLAQESDDDELDFDTLLAKLKAELHHGKTQQH